MSFETVKARKNILFDLDGTLLPMVLKQIWKYLKIISTTILI